MFILPEFCLRIRIESASEFDHGDIESIKLKMIPVPMDYKTSVVNAGLKVMYAYHLYPTKFGGVESREATTEGIVWLTDEEINLLNDCKDDCIEFLEFLNKFIEYTMGFKPFKDKKEDNNEPTNQEEGRKTT